MPVGAMAGGVRRTREMLETRASCTSLKPVFDWRLETGGEAGEKPVVAMEAWAPFTTMSYTTRLYVCLFDFIHHFLSIDCIWALTLSAVEIYHTTPLLIGACSYKNIAHHVQK
jgi:hypothetical protein